MKALREILSESQISTEPSDLVCYGFDASRIDRVPGAVVWPEGTDDVVALSRYAFEEGIPLIPRGAGSGMTGGAVPERGGIVVSFERMRRILDIDKENLNVLVEPGLINGTLQRELALEGYFYPPDPASMNFCTIGGNVAENAGGPRALKYGVTRDYVMELEAVLPDGRVLSTGVKTPKGVVGYDLTRLLVGSEGTLATITKVRLRFLPEPEALVTLLGVFGDVFNAAMAVSQIISSRIIPRALELMDRNAVRVVEEFRPIGLNTEAPLLIIELDGNIQDVRRQAEKVAEICQKLGAQVSVAEDVRERERLWEARRAISPALNRISPTKINEDIVVPRTEMADMLRFLEELSEKEGIPIVSFGHAGDGNIHVNIMVNEEDHDLYMRGVSLVKSIFQETLEREGTISGEHGIGLTKADYITMEIDQTGLDMMRGIKRLFDPKNILNPGKIFP